MICTKTQDYINLRREIEIEPRLRKAVDLGLAKRIDQNGQKPGRNIATIFKFSLAPLCKRLISRVLAKNYNTNRRNNYG